jgi:hypothetical protein
MNVDARADGNCPLASSLIAIALMDSAFLTAPENDNA